MRHITLFTEFLLKFRTCSFGEQILSFKSTLNFQIIHSAVKARVKVNLWIYKKGLENFKEKNLYSVVTYIFRLITPGYLCTVNPLHKDIRYNSKISYNVNLVCTKISGSCIFSLILPFYTSGKHMFFVIVRIASLRRF